MKSITLTDADLRRNVEEELRWDPDIDATDVAVNALSGVVTLTGFVRSYVQRTQAEIDTKRVAGVHAVANDLEVHLPSRDVRPDPEIARDCVTQLEFDLPTSHEQVKLIVENGWVSLEGSVIWNFQRERAAEAVRHIRGVTGVSNFIEVKPKVPATEIREKIESALSRIAVLDASRITVETQGGVVKLHGVVHSWAEREEAERAAWAAPGVTSVDNQIAVNP